MKRRTLLGLGVASAAVLLAVGGALTLVTPGLRHGKLSAQSQEIFEALGNAILDGTLPAQPEARSKALAGMLDRINDLVSALPPHAQDELSQLLALLSTASGRMTLGGLSTAWRDASIAETQVALQSMRLSSLGLRQQAYQALHDIVGGAYFSDASTWAQLGYPGPMPL